MKDVITEVWMETFQGVEEGAPSHFIETKPDTGIFGTIRLLSAKQASKDINGTSIAAHIHHTMYHMKICLSYLDDLKPEADWSESWKIENLTEEEWQEIKEELTEQYEKMLDHIKNDTIDDFTLRFFLSSLSHAAYHLGAIRQMMKTL
jgi:hypothetical protein